MDSNGSTSTTITSPCLADGLEIDARYVIAADGMWSPVRKSVGANESGYLGEWHGFRQYARNVTGPPAQQLHVWFEPDLVPGYAWSFPLPGGRVNIGFGVLRDGSRRIQDMKQLWTDLLARPHVVEALGDGFELEDRHTAWPIPARVDEATLTAGRVLFTGDAAMATDVMTGEGIGQALLTGRLAAEAIIAAGALQPDRRCGDLSSRGRPPPVRRPPDVACAGIGTHHVVGRARRDPGRRCERRLGPTELRPLDVRRRTTCRRAHTQPLAPPLPRPARRLGELRVS